MQKHTKGMLEQRINILEGRTDKDNTNIVKKLERKVRKLGE